MPTPSIERLGKAIALVRRDPRLVVDHAMWALWPVAMAESAIQDCLFDRAPL